MEVTVPITPRRTRALRPLLPPGPGGVDNVSSRGDRYGRHRLCSTRILIALRSDCHQGKRELAGTFHAGGRTVARLVIRSWGGAIAGGAQHARRFAGNRYGPPQRAAPTVRVATTSAILSAFDGEHDARSCTGAPEPRLGTRQWGRGLLARIPGSRAWGRGCGPAARGPGRRPTACLVLSRPCRRPPGCPLPWVVRSKGGCDGCRRGRPAPTPAHPIAVAKSPMRYASRNRAPSGRSHEFLTCSNHMRT